MADVNERFEPLSERQYVNRYEGLIEDYRKAGFIENKYAAPGVLNPYVEHHSDYFKAAQAVLMNNVKNEMLGASGYKMSLEDALKVAAKAREFFGEATTPTTTGAVTGATNLPMVLGYIAKILPRMIALNLVQIQPLDRPVGRVFSISRIRHDNATNAGEHAARAGWSYRSWVDDPGEASTINKSVKFSLTSADVSVTSKKLKAETGIEVEQDLRAYHGMDAVALVSDTAAEEMAMELDETLLHFLWTGQTGGTVFYGSKPSGYTVDEWDKRLVEALQRASSLVFTKKRVVPNNIVVGSEWEVRLANLAVFAAIQGGHPIEPAAAGGLRMIGTLLGRWRVFSSPLPFPTADALLVYKGNSWTDATAFYLPYVPVMLAGIHFDPATQLRTLSWLRRDTQYLADGGQMALSTINEVTYTGFSYPAWVEYTG